MLKNIQYNNVDNVNINSCKNVKVKDTLKTIQEDSVNIVGSDSMSKDRLNVKKVQKDQKNKKNRRPLRGRKIIFKKSLNILSGNANGLKNKLLSLENIIIDLKPSIIGIQETHFQKMGQIKVSSLSNYQVYEHVRNDRNGGGLAMCVIKELEPVWIRDGGQDVEALTVCISAGKNLKVRITNAYGPQEYDCIEKKTVFGNILTSKFLLVKIKEMDAL